MKRANILILMFFVFSTYMLAENNFSLSIYANYLRPADSNYKDVYGNGKVFPEIKLNTGRVLFQNFSLWGSLGYLPANGTVVGMNETAKSKQIFVALGGKYKYKFSPSLHVGLRLGILYVNYSEKALGTKVDGSTLGFTTGIGVVYDINNTFFAEVESAYMYAHDEIPGTVNIPESTSVKLGGLKLGFGLGIKF